MRYRSTLAPQTFFYLLLFASPVVCEPFSAGKDGVLYLNAEKTYFYKIGSTKTDLGVFRSNTKDASFLVDRGIGGAPTADCSSRSFLCRQVHNMVFAVPRAPLSATSQYIAAGARFKVDKCYQYTDKKCSVALVESNCEFLTEAGKCEPYSNGRVASANPGPVVYFIFNERYGVVSFGFGADFVPDLETAENSAQYLLLQGDRGLLK
jgi:hypothetical protein